MAIVKFKPTSPGRRFGSKVVLEIAGNQKVPRKLGKPLKSNAGRNNQGRITIHHRGGGHKRKLRIMDFKRDKPGIKGKVEAIQYDPNRSANIALINYADGEKRYILAPAGLKLGQEVVNGPAAEPEVGNALPLRNIPSGTFVHNVELTRGRGGQIARSAGSMVQLMSKEGKWAHLRLGSGEIRRVALDCLATVGQVGNTDHSNISLGKAGRKRWLGIRPTVRGTAMNIHDHPLGGGRGKSKGGNIPVSRWGTLAKGGKTRKKRKYSDKYIIQPRRKKRRK